MIVSSHLFAHHARFVDQPDLPKFVYAHTPARYVWTPHLDERGKGMLAKSASHWLRPIDKARASEAVAIAANSEYVRLRINHAWERDAEVIYPPVDVDRISGRSWAGALTGSEQALLDGLPSEFILGASRFIPYKRLDLVIDAGARLGQPVVIAGSGPLEERLREHARQAGTPATFIISPSDSLLYALYERATAFVFPAVEDFGIMPVEAMAAGCPVVAVNMGGASETVVEGISGAKSDDQTAGSLASAFERASVLDRALIPRSVRRFASERFENEILGWMEARL